MMKKSVIHDFFSLNGSDSYCFSRHFDQNSFLFRDVLNMYTNSGPPLLKSWLMTIRGAFVICEWTLLDNMAAYKLFLFERDP